MMQELSEVLKRHRHTMGRLLLILGSGVPLRTDRLSSAERLQRALADYALSLGKGGGPAELASADTMDPDAAVAHQYVAPHFRDVEMSEGHLRLARLIKEGYFPTVITMGIDDCLERALAQEHLHPEEQYNLVNVGASTRREILGALAESRRVTLVKARGTLGQGAIAFTRRQVQSHLRRIERYLYDSGPATLILVGYCDADADLLASIRREGGPVWWVNPRYPLSDAQEFDRMKVEAPESLRHHELQPAVVELLQARRSERTVFCRESGQFDNFFHELYDRRVRKSRDRGERGRSRDTITLEPEAPYRLLDPMELRDAQIFHGREPEIEWLEQSLADHRVVVVFGETGIGKTSLLTAGLAPRLSEEGAVPVLFHIGADPRREAVSALARAAVTEDEPVQIDEGSSIPDAVRAAGEALGGRIVLLLDQAEDLILRIGPRTREEFARQIGEALRDEDLDVRLVMTVSDSGFPLLYELLEELPTLYHRVLRLGPLSRSQARQVLVRAAARYERRWEEDLIDRILDDLGPNRLQTTELSVVCYRSYATLGRSRVVTLRAYEALGGSEKILRNLLSDSLQTLGRREREAARQVLRALVRAEGAKAPLALEQIVARCPRLDRDRVERMLWMLADARLVLRVGRERERTYELVSEWLVPQVWEGVTEEERTLRESEDRVARGLSDWRLFETPLAPEVLRAVGPLRGRLHLTEEELGLAVRSAAVHGVDVEAWLDLAKTLGEREVPLLGAILRSVPGDSQARIVDRLDALGSDAAIKVLLDALSDLGDAATEKARAALEKRGQAVAAAVRDSSGEERARALEALGTVATPEAVGPLIEVVDDTSEDASVREVAVSALANVAQRAGGRASAGLISRLADSRADQLDPERATALARVVTAEGETATLHKAAATTPEAASLRYAAFLVALDSKDVWAAEEQLEALEHSVPDHEEGQELLRSARAAAAALRARQEAGHFEWTMFRKDALHSGLSHDHAPTLPKVLWRARTEGQVLGSPAITGGHCYVGAKDGVLRCLDLLTGKENWSRRLGPSIESSVALAGDLVVAGCIDHRVYACDRRSGRVRWQADLDGEVRASVTVAGDRVLAASWSGSLYALALEDGRVLWRSTLGGAAYAAPAVCDGRIYIGSWAGAVHCLDAETGGRLFDVPMRAEVNAAVSVLPATGLGAAGSDSGEVVAFDLTGPSVAHRFETGGAVRAAPLLDESALYVGSGDGALRAFCLESGEERFCFRTADPIVGSPAMTPDHLVFGSRDGSLYCIRRSDGGEEFRIPTSYSVVSSPALVDGVIYVGMDYYELHAIAQGEEADPR